MSITNVESVDESFPRFLLGRMRLMNQLRGKVTSCNTPPYESSLRAMMNDPESISARLHRTSTSARSSQSRNSLRE